MLTSLLVDQNCGGIKSIVSSRKPTIKKQQSKRREICNAYLFIG